ncbi:MAG: hypothetical protein V4659_13525 [Pseudomonadota bacterium]
MADTAPEDQDPARSLRITDLCLDRRAFLGGSGVLVASALSAAPLDTTQPVFEQGDGGVIRVRRGSGATEKVWEIDPAWFVGDRDPWLPQWPGSSQLKWVSNTELRVNGRFAGTNLPAVFTLTIRDFGGVWKFVWKFADDPAQSIAVDDWFAGPNSVGPIVLVPLGGAAAGGSLRVIAPVRVWLKWPFVLETSADSPPSFKFRLGKSAGSAKYLKLTPYGNPSGNGAVPNTHVSKLLPAGALHKLRIELRDVVLTSPSDGWEIGKIGDSWLRWSPLRPELRIEVIWRPAERSFMSVWRLGSNGSSRLQIGDADRPRSILLGEEAELLEVGGYNLGTAPTYALIADLSEEPLTVQGLRYAATLRGSGSTLLTGFRNSATLTFPATLLTLHARGSDDARYDVDFRGYKPGGTYLDRSAIPWRSTQSMDGHPVDLTIGVRPTPKLNDNQLHLGSNSGAAVLLHPKDASAIGLANPILRVRRHRDGFDLGFVFHQCRIEVDNDGSRIRGLPGAQRGVRFHPQHLQEEVFDPPPGDSVANTPGGLLHWAGALIALTAGLIAPAPALKIRVLGSLANSEFDEDGIQTKLARTRVAGSSRVIFRPRAFDKLPLTVKSLTDWAGEQVAAMKRVDAARGTLEEQISSLGITVDTDRPTARDLVNAQFVAPAGDETSLELVTGLTFSPDQHARFRVPRTVPGANPALWTAQLELLPIDPITQMAGQIRAIWADELLPQSVIGTAPCGTPLPIAAEPPFETSLNGRDRAEIVMLSSTLGLPALRALSETGKDIPASLVRLPKEATGRPYKYLDSTARAHPRDPRGPTYRQEGVMAPAPFTRFSARLTAFGADLDAEWSGEPVAPWVSPTKGIFFNRAFSVERYVHRTSLGSDMFVEVVYKGFLFPYGFRVALIKVTQRQAYEMGEWGAMMPAIQRHFIIPKPVAKSMPGIYQPFNGFEIPIRRAELDPVRSPELDPTMEVPPEIAAIMAGFPSPTQTPVPNGICPPEQRKPVGSVFWPRLRGEPGSPGREIAFDFTADDTGVRRSLPMLFLDNAAVHDAPTVRAVVHYYNTLNDVQLRTEQHHGGPTIFAVPAKTGDTTFATESILLKARSRIVDTATAPGVPGAGVSSQNDPDLAQYQMDAFMEGADEPPFYPVMEEAKIVVPPLDRLLGSPQGFKRVGYNANYLRNGFDRRGNPSSLYLNFLDADGVMQLGGRGEISGGVAQTPTSISGISRDNAIVGAPGRPPPTGAAPVRLVAAALATVADQRVSGQPAVGSDHQTPWDLSDVVAGSFNPAKFFKLPKLLGVIDIGEAVGPALIAKQPKLREVYDYAIDKKDETAGVVVARFSAAAVAAGKALNAALDDAEQRLIGFLGEEGIAVLSAPPVRPNLAQLYPDLARQLTNLAQDLEEAALFRDIGDIIKAASPLIDQWREVKGAVDAVIANPTPEPVRGIVKGLRAIIDDLVAALGGTLTRQANTALSAFLTQFVTPLRDAILDRLIVDAQGVVTNPWLYEAFFGPIPPDVKVVTRAELKVKIDVLIVSPNQLPVGLVAAPLASAMTVPLLRIIGAARDLTQAADQAATQALARIAETALGALRAVVDGVAELQALADVARAGAAAMCAGATQPLWAVADLAFAAVPDKQRIADLLAAFDRRNVTLTLPNLPASPAVDQVRDAAAGFAATVQRLASQFVAINACRATLPGDAVARGAWCADTGRLPAAIAEFLRWRSGVIAALDDCAMQAGRIGDALSKLSAAEQTQAKKARDAATETLQDLIVLARECTLARLATGANEASSALAVQLRILPPPVIARLAAVRAEAYRAAVTLNDAVAALPPAPSAADLIGILARTAPLAAVEHRLFALATDFSAVTDQILVRVGALARNLAGTVGKPVIDLHIAVLGQADDAIRAVKAAPDIVAMLTGPLLGRLAVIRTALAKDILDLQKLLNDPGQARGLIDRWEGDPPGLAQTTRTIAELFDAIARGQLGALFDLAAARRAVEEAVRRLIPSKVTLTYAWDAELNPIPAGNPIFNPGAIGTRPLATGTRKDLTLKTQIEVDLLNPKDRKVSVVGTLATFHLHLLGSSPDLVKIEFANTKFESDGSGSPSFKTNIANVEIGEDLKFLKALQETMKRGSGLSVLPSITPPGIMVSYGIGEPKIECVGITFLNVNFSVGVLLPFNGDKALFRFAFASRALPFGIIIAPYYYGGGFVALEADASGVVSFEIQLEFGAARDFSFGPMRGYGKIATGIYMMTGRGGRRLEGFVHAVGEGQIACFGISVNIDVTVRPEGSSMTGKAKYSYSFSVGIASVSYEFEAEFTFQGGIGATRAPPPLPIVPALAPGRVTATVETAASYKLEYVDRRTDWEKWRRRFISEWP